MPGRHRREGIWRLSRADVVRLVDHDEDRIAFLAPPPQITEHRRGDEGLLLAARQRAQVDDDTADARIVNRVEDRTGLAGSPHRVAVHAEVLDAQAEPYRLRKIVSGQRLYRGRVLAGEHRRQRGVFFPVGDRVQPEGGRLGRRLDVGRVQPEPSLAVGAGGVDRDSARRLTVAPGQRRVRARAHLAQARKVRVRVEDHHAQVRLGQEPFEDHAERVRLARSGLAAQERVPVETRGVRHAGHPGGKRQLA